METILGLLGVVVFIVGVLALSAGVTWTVVKVSPQRAKKLPEIVE
jgi:hypothetical protein